MSRIDRLATLLALALAACGSDGGSGTDGPGGGDAAGGLPDLSAARDAALPADAQSPPSGLWSLGYYASWQPDQYPVDQIEWSGLTHIAFAFYGANPDGSLTLAGADPQVAQSIIAAAHAHGVKAIASIGGADSGPSLETATSGATRAAFVGQLVDLLKTTGYDGIDIDWEPLNANDQPIAIDLAQQIRAAQPAAIMTVTVGYQNVNAPDDLTGYPALAAAYDQMNIMTYGMAGAWPGWKSWHSSPLYQQDSATPLSIDSSVQLYVAAGVPKAKLGVGIGFFGMCYTAPVTAPDQALSGSMVAASDGTMSYANIVADYLPGANRTFDPLARVPYLDYGGASHGGSSCSYVSYEDEQSIGEKGAYLKSSGLGGVIEWEINEGYLPSAPAGQRSPLLTAIGDHVLR